MHQSMANQIRAVYNNELPDTSKNSLILYWLILYALRVGVYSVLNMAPGSITFQRDMIMNLPFVVDLNNIRKRRQCLVDKNNDGENAKLTDYNYSVREWILIRNDTYTILSKLEERYITPYQIVQVHVNGTLAIH